MNKNSQQERFSKMNLINKTTQGYQLRDVVAEFTATSAIDVGHYFQDRIGRQLQEHFVVLSLNAALEVISADTIAIGQITGVHVTPRDIFQIALLNNAASIMVGHNHPSGRIQPSLSDDNTTQELKKLSDVMQLPLHDHFVVSAHSYYSYAEHQKL